MGLSNGYHELAEVVGQDEAIRIGTAIWRECRPPCQRRRGGRTPSFGHQGGRGTLYIPEQPTPQCVAAQVIGFDATERLATVYGGTSITLGFPSAYHQAKFDERVAKLVAEGASTRFIAAAEGVAASTLKRSRRRTNTRGGPGRYRKVRACNVAECDDARS